MLPSLLIHTQLPHTSTPPSSSTHSSLTHAPLPPQPHTAPSHMLPSLLIHILLQLLHVGILTGATCRDSQQSLSLLETKFSLEVHHYSPVGKEQVYGTYVHMYMYMYKTCMYMYKTCFYKYVTLHAHILKSELLLIQFKSYQFSSFWSMFSKTLLGHTSFEYIFMKQYNCI